jgi:hypothetical protein
VLYRWGSSSKKTGEGFRVYRDEVALALLHSRGVNEWLRRLDAEGVVGAGKKLGTSPGEEQRPDEARDGRGGDKK